MKTKMGALITIVLVASSFAHSEPRSMGKSAADVAVTDLQIEGQTINQLLASLAYKCNVPISLEVATNEDLINSHRLTVQRKKGTLADVLDDIVKQKPTYVWEATKDTIKVFPKSDYRDPLLQTLLEVRISRVVIGKSTVKLNFREALTRSPEGVKSFV